VTRPARRPHAVKRASLGGLALLFVALFLALGIWQIQRRTWKHALIARVEERVQATPVAPPPPSRWAGVNAQADAYRHVRLTGRFRTGRDVFVLAVTNLGSGYWVMTPLDTGAFDVLINRGFVSQEDRPHAAAPPQGPVPITGLLRITEPGGGFLRSNDPTAKRWYSRDVAAIAHAIGLGRTAPYFVDADVGLTGPGQPVGGLTVVQFADNHLVYALTWFALAGFSGWAAWRVLGKRSADAGDAH
jgi:surfeit locus 1 family protein